MPLEPQMNGGASTTLYRSGTPALGLAASSALALQLACDERESRCAVVQRHSERLRKALARIRGAYQQPEHAVPHILNLSVKNVKGTVFQRALSEKGVCVSVKSACSADGLPSRAVFAVSRDRRNALSSWRISLSHLTTDAEIDEFLSVFDACYHELVK
ncbi:MAG: aminotransferase class V-fold PLP-dependent enzyme [Butyricicoccus sp.]